MASSLLHARSTPAQAAPRARQHEEVIVALLKRMIEDESAQGMTGYAILIGTLALGAVVTLLAIAGRLRDVFGGVQTHLNSVPNAPSKVGRL
jgi:Flp pilus assembly pilin Flp